MKTHRRSSTKAEVRPAPVLDFSPFEPLELVGIDNLSEDDRTYLHEREGTIEAGRRTFLEVGKALIEIRGYRDGLLYKRYGTFEAYCRERWEFGRSYASRIMDATEVYLEMLPRGNKMGAASPLLPTTEKQLRSLKKLPAELRLRAWNNALEVAGTGPVLARYVDREVYKLTAIQNSSAAGKAKRKKEPLPPASHRIGNEDLEKIHAELNSIKRLAAKSKQGAKILEAIHRLEALLPN